MNASITTSLKLTDALARSTVSLDGVTFRRFKEWTNRKAEACPCENCRAMAEDADVIFGMALLSTVDPHTGFEDECRGLVGKANQT